MATDATYSPGIYRKQGGNILAIGASGKLNAANASTSPATSSLNANVVSATVTGNDFAGSISVVLSGTAPVAGQTLFTVTFANAYANAPLVQLTNASGGVNGAAAYAGAYGLGTVTASSFQVVNLAGLANSSTVVLNYMVVGVE